MCSSRSLLILSSIAASVVDLPEPVGPVTSTRPRGLSHKLSTICGQAERVESLDFPGNRPKDGAHGAALMEDVAAETRQALQAERKVELQVFFEAMLLRVGQHAVGQRLGVRRGQRRHVQRPQMAVNAHPRRAVGREMQIAAAQLDHLLQQLAQGDASHFVPLLTEPFRARLLPSSSAPGDFGKSAAPQRDHSQFQRFLLQLQRRRADQNQFAKFVVDFHHFVEADAALVAGVVAGRAAFAVYIVDLAGFLRCEARLDQRLRLHLQRFLAVRADAPHQALRADQVHRRRHRNGSIPMFINRLMVDGASLVCSVESTRWPVSAALTAISAVSKSRISPTRMMFGSCRRKERSAAAKFRPICSFI